MNRLELYEKYYGDIIFPEEVTPEFVKKVLENRTKYIMSYTGLYWDIISENITSFEKSCMFKKVPDDVYIGRFPDLLANPEDFLYAHIGSTQWHPVKYSDSAAWVYHGTLHLWFKKK